MLVILQTLQAFLSREVFELRAIEFTCFTDSVEIS